MHVYLRTRLDLRGGLRPFLNLNSGLSLGVYCNWRVFDRWNGWHPNYVIVRVLKSNQRVGQS